MPPSFRLDSGVGADAGNDHIQINGRPIGRSAICGVVYRVGVSGLLGDHGYKEGWPELTSSAWLITPLAFQLVRRLFPPEWASVRQVVYGIDLADGRPFGPTARPWTEIVLAAGLPVELEFMRVG